MTLSIVVACLGLHERVDACLDAIDVATARTGAHVILAITGVSQNDLARIMRRRPSLTTVTVPGGALVPQLWAAGLEHAAGDLVAFTSSQCCVSPEWAEALIAEARRGAQAIGGPLEIAESSGGVTSAVFFLRYSAFTREQLGAGTVAGEIAGDNAAYARSLLKRHEASFESGFWEVEFHRLVRADGAGLVAAPRAMALFHGGTPYVSMLRHRFAHGRQFGAGRVASHARSASLTALLAPAVPLVLLGRIARRVLPIGRYRLRFVASVPALFGLAVAWAAGEGWGAMTGSGVASRALRSPGCVQSDGRA